MTPDQIAELKRIAEAATQSEWSVGDKARFQGVEFIPVETGNLTVCEVHGDDGVTVDAFARAHAVHIATFDPPTCLALIAENAAQAARIEALEAGLKPFAEAAGHLHPAHPENGLTLDGIEVRHWHRAANLLDAARAEGPATPGGGGEEARQEPKYRFDGGRVWNRADGQPIPLDEPVFVFRARDTLALPALRHYALVVNHHPQPGHLEAVLARVADFERFAAAHPDRMKQPDTAVTKGADRG